MRFVNWMTVIAISALAFAMPLCGQNAKSNQPAQQEHITLPQYSTELPPGPHLEDFRQHCLLCHSARYVTTQPRFSPTVWQNEVKKMVTAYGAPIPEADQAKIVEYLVAIKGAPATASAAAPSKPEAPKTEPPKTEPPK